MHSKTFQFNGATITVAPETGAAYIDRQIAQNTLGVFKPDADMRTVNYRLQFAAVYAQSAIEGHLGFEWPTDPFDEDTMLAACDAWLALPGNVVAQWLTAINTANIPPNDPDLLPPDQVSEKKDKTKA